MSEYRRSPKERLRQTAVTLLFVGPWATFLLAPALSSSIMRSGIFVPSKAWNDVWYWYVALGALIGLLLFICACLSTVLALRLSDWTGARIPRKAMVWIVGGLLVILPFWGWGVEHGVISIWMHNHAPQLGETSIPAVVTSYSELKHRKGSVYYQARVTVPSYGAITFEHVPYFPIEQRPMKGSTFTLAGHRSWVGAYYDTPLWSTATPGMVAPQQK
jgi:hypothetical protein